MNEFIIMADGTTVKNAYVVKIDTGLIAIYVQGEHTFSKMSKLFSNTKKTEVMESDRYGDKQTWEGYTEIISLQINPGNACIELRQNA